MTDLSNTRIALEHRFQTLSARLARIQEDLRSPGHPDSAEQATELENDQVLERLDEAELQEIDQIRAALDRIDSGEYGTCARCGEPIGEGRLSALPYAATCIGCAA